MTSDRTATLGAADLASRLRVSVWRLARRMRQASDPGITPTLHAALFTIEHHGPVTAGQLAAHEQVTKPTMTRTIGMLLEQELIVRTTDPLDGRVTWLSITPAGSKLLQRARRRTDEYLSKRVKALDPGDRATLEDAARILERLAEPGR
ncbi:MAG: MarR family transcriptional regulator [Thermoleophilaceae bacterium]